MTSYINFSFSLQNAEYCNLVSANHTKYDLFHAQSAFSMLYNDCFPSVTYVLKVDLWVHV